jgi:low affinity Fe/Cu permease
MATHPKAQPSASGHPTHPTERHARPHQGNDLESVEHEEEKIEQVQQERAAAEGPLYTINRWFRTMASATARAMGSPWAFILAVLTVIVWSFTRPLFKSADTWQLVINTGTTIVTFLMIFLVQNTQNRDAKAIHLKLDELLRGVKGARTAMVDLEDATDEELDDLQKQFEKLRRAKAEQRGRRATSRSHHQTAQDTSPSSDPD